eukprot:CAMPEP_0185692888 /NCGR_PEP_ID=MMETSP1164-20130828/2857_1 /TAXON_ID=1104430 /ORGANISM="Chrysoreinhardia sp, Strain CCMP2950" /LENGTH=172 /DNA_ID=CAMNT_0028359645 /DNA_START=44 /DNA_END=560 /DNA_ORIENTATION=-
MSGAAVVTTTHGGGLGHSCCAEEDPPPDDDDDCSAHLLSRKGPPPSPTEERAEDRRPEQPDVAQLLDEAVFCDGVIVSCALTTARYFLTVASSSFSTGLYSLARACGVPSAAVASPRPALTAPRREHADVIIGRAGVITRKPAAGRAPRTSATATSRATIGVRRRRDDDGPI